MHKLSLTSQKKLDFEKKIWTRGSSNKEPNLRKIDMHQLILGSKAKSSTKFFIKEKLNMIGLFMIAEKTKGMYQGCAII